MHIDFVVKSELSNLQTADAMHAGSKSQLLSHKIMTPQSQQQQFRKSQLDNQTPTQTEMKIEKLIGSKSHTNKMLGKFRDPMSNRDMRSTSSYFSSRQHTANINKRISHFRQMNGRRQI